MSDVTKHTPGKWYVAERQRLNSDVRFIRTDFDDSGVVCVTNDNDAKLVAAAPDLLEALEEVNVWINSSAIDEDGVVDEASRLELSQKVHAAIAKATGKQAEP